MKLLLIAFSLMFMAVSCNRNQDSGTEYQQEKQEADKEYSEKVKDAQQERSEEVKGAQEDLQEEQKEEAKDYIDESDAARIDRGEQEVDVQESTDQQ